MDILALLIFIPACFALNLAPGPNNLMAMKNAKDLGFKVALLAGLGRLFAFSVMIVVAATGLAQVLLASQTLFMVIKVLGACYLMYLAYGLWQSNTADEDLSFQTQRGGLLLAKQEFMLAIGNPKAILIFTAFLPQFIDTSQAISQQFFILGALFLTLEWLAIAMYACFGIYLRKWFANPRTRSIFNKICAGFLGSAGGALLLSSK